MRRCGYGCWKLGLRILSVGSGRTGLGGNAKPIGGGRIQMDGYASRLVGKARTEMRPDGVYR